MSIWVPSHTQPGVSKSWPVAIYMLPDGDGVWFELKRTTRRIFSQKAKTREVCWYTRRVLTLTRNSTDDSHPPSPSTPPPLHLDRHLHPHLTLTVTFIRILTLGPIFIIVRVLMPARSTMTAIQRSSCASRPWSSAVRLST